MTLIVAAEIEPPGPTVACVVGALLRERCGGVTEDHPLTTVVEPLVDEPIPSRSRTGMLQERDRAGGTRLRDAQAPL